MILLALAAGAAATAPSVPPLARCHLAVEQGRWPEAQAACKESLVADGDQEALILLARANLQLGDSAESKRLATSALGGKWNADALTVLGVLDDRAGKSDAARSKLYQAIAEFQRSGNARELSRAWFALAGSFLRNRLLNETLDALDSASAAAETAEDARLAGLIALMHGDVMRLIGDARSAERDYDQAANALAGRPSDLAYVDLKLGILRQEEGMLSLSDISFHRALSLAQATGIHDAAVAARQNLAFNAHLSGHAKAGIAELAGWQGPFDFSHFAISAMLEADEGRLTEAVVLMDKALSLTHNNDAWWGEFERGRMLERLGNDAGAEQGFARSIAIVEQMRAVMDSGELQAWMIPRRREPYEALLALFIRQNKTVEALQVLEAFSARSFVDALIINGSLNPRGDVLDAVSAWERLEISAADDWFDSLSQRDVLIPVEVLGRLYVAYKSKEGEMRFADRGDVAHVRDLAQRFAENPDLTELGEELGRILVPDDLDDHGPLHVIASGWLAAIPFAALRREKQFLIQLRALASVPSLSALARIPASDHPTGTLVLGDADGSLPAARAEAIEVANALGTRATLGGEATSLRIEVTAPFELLHLGTHAGLDGGSAWLSLADRRWTTDQILASGVTADVVVLATCSSATTHHQEAWGSLAVAFLANGSRSVIASLGSIDDNDTRNVMRALYKSDVRRHPIQALAEAQRSVADSMPPHAWANFVVYSAGDD